MQALLHSVPPTLHQSTADRASARLLVTHRQVWVSLLWGHCSFLLGPDAHKFFSCVPSKSLFPQSCVSSGSSLVKLKVTSSKRAYAIPRSSKPRAPAPEADIRKRWQEYTEELYRKDQIITKV